MNPTAESIRDTVLAALRRIAPDVDPATLQPTQNVREALDIDSYDFLQFLIALNKQLGVDVPEADYGKLQTLEQVTEYFRRRAADAP